MFVYKSLGDWKSRKSLSFDVIIESLPHLWTVILGVFSVNEFSYYELLNSHIKVLL
jgi:hypothetical protein